MTNIISSDLIIKLQSKQKKKKKEIRKKHILFKYKGMDIIANIYITYHHKRSLYYKIYL